MLLKEFDRLLDYYYHLNNQEKRDMEDELSSKAQKILENCKDNFMRNEQYRKQKVIVSLTSIPERLEHVVYPIQCMLIQTYRPDKVILWLDAYRLNDEVLPSKLVGLKQYGLEICYVEDIGPHTKYYYAMKTYPRDIIITIDDDLIYQRTLVEGLVNTYIQNPKCVCAYWVWQMKFTCHGIPYPSSEYGVGDESQNNMPDKKIAALGFGGVLYPPGCLNAEAFEAEKIRRLALKADDVWLKAMEVLNDTLVVKAAGRRPYLHITNSQIIALKYENLAGRNDAIIKKVFKTYYLMRYFTEYEKLENSKVKTLLKWVSIYQSGIKLTDYLNRRNVKTIAVYGIGQLGKAFLDEMENTAIEIKYGIDQKVEGMYKGIPIIKLEHANTDVDLVVITAPVSYQEISLHLKFDLISLEDLLVEMMF